MSGRAPQLSNRTATVPYAGAAQHSWHTCGGIFRIMYSSPLCTQTLKDDDDEGKKNQRRSIIFDRLSSLAMFAGACTMCHLKFGMCSPMQRYTPVFFFHIHFEWGTFLHRVIQVYVTSASFIHLRQARRSKISR